MLCNRWFPLVIELFAPLTNPSCLHSNIQKNIYFFYFLYTCNISTLKNNVLILYGYCVLWRVLQILLPISDIHTFHCKLIELLLKYHYNKMFIFHPVSFLVSSIINSKNLKFKINDKIFLTNI